MSWLTNIATHLSMDALLRELVSSLQAQTNHAREGNNGDVGTLPHDLGLIKRQHKVILGAFIRDREGCAIHKLVLEEDNGIGVADAGLHCSHNHKETQESRVTYTVRVMRDWNLIGA